jgi:gluconate 2-dehydrogenase gamma chain
MNSRLTRARLLRQAGLAAGALGVTGLAGCADDDDTGSGAALLSGDTEAVELGWVPPQRPPLDCRLLSFFTPTEGRAVEAIMARLIPGSPGDPGAREACVTGFVDAKLARYPSFATPTYFHGPFATPVRGGRPGPQQHAKEEIEVLATELPRYGFQSGLTPQQTYRLGLAELEAFAREQLHAPFVELAENDQDDVLELMEAFAPPDPDPAKAADQRRAQQSPEGQALSDAFEKPTPYGFFSTVLEDAYEGMFSDPLYGGNRDFAGWLLVGYPGAQRAYTPRELTRGPHRRRVQGLADMPAMHPGNPADDVMLPVSGTRETERR